jgi:hypothetical protein
MPQTVILNGAMVFTGGIPGVASRTPRREAGVAASF